MNKQRLLNMSYDLNIKLAYSDIEGHITFKQFDDETLGIAFTHFSDYYEKGCGSIHIYGWHELEDAKQSFEAIKEVIAGERLVTDETDSHVPN
jgi:hypothetical protein